MYSWNVRNHSGPSTVEPSGGRRYYAPAVVLLLGLVANVFGAELKCVNKPERDSFVTVSSDKAGKWLVIGPTAITVTPTASIAGTTVGQTSVNFRKTIVEDGGKVCNFVGPPGPYAVVQIADDEAEPSHLVVTIPGEVKPAPKPPIDDDDKPEPQPKPDVSKVERVVIVEESAKRTAEQAAVFFQIRGQWGQEPGQIPVLIVDKDSEVQTYAKAINACRNDNLPVVCFLDSSGDVVAKRPMPKTYAEFKELGVK